MPRAKSKRRKLQHVSLDEQANAARQDARVRRVAAELADMNLRAAELAVNDDESVGAQDGWEKRRDQSADAKVDAERIATGFEAQAAALSKQAPSKKERDATRVELLKATRTEIEGHLTSGEGTLAAHYRQIDAGEGDRSIFAAAVEQGLSPDDARKAAISRAELDAYAWENSLAAAEAKLAEVVSELGPEEDSAEEPPA